MAVRFDNILDDMTRTTNLPSISSFTMMGWFRIAVDLDAISTFMAFGVTTGNDYYRIDTDSDGTTLRIHNSASALTGSALTVGDWNHLAITVSGTGSGQFLAYLNAVLNITHDGDSGPIAEVLHIGNSSALASSDGNAAAVKIYDAVLTAAEIAQEMRQYLPVRTANINAFYPLLTTADDQVDYSGNARTLTVAGTLATEDGPPIPWKTGRSRFMTFTAAAAAGRIWKLAGSGGGLVGPSRGLAAERCI